MRDLFPQELVEQWSRPGRKVPLGLVFGWSVAAVTVTVCGWYLLLGDWAHRLAAVLTLLLVALVALGATWVRKQVLWRRCRANQVRHCVECQATWASRAEFVGLHRENAPRSVRWWMWRRLPTFCPSCLHEL